MEQLIFEHVTDTDKNISTLAETKAKCERYILLNKCNKEKCKQCSINSKLNLCYNALPLCDQLRLDNMSDNILLSMLITDKRYKMEKHRNKIGNIFSKGILIFVIMCLVLMWCAIFAHAEDLSDRREYIWDTLERTHSQVKDINYDGVVNCIDYTVTFKHEWDKKYPSYNCQIIRNYNIFTGWHHLYVRVKLFDDDYYWHSVEPQGDKGCYDMFTYWGSKYETKFDHEETRIWYR